MATPTRRVARRSTPAGVSLASNTEPLSAPLTRSEPVSALASGHSRARAVRAATRVRRSSSTLHSSTPGPASTRTSTPAPNRARRNDSCGAISHNDARSYCTRAIPGCSPAMPGFAYSTASATRAAPNPRSTRSSHVVGRHGPSRQTARPRSPPRCSMGRQPAGPRWRDRLRHWRRRACAWFLPRWRLLHLQLDPAVGDVVLTLHDPVVAGVRRSDHGVRDRVPDQLVVGIEERRDRRQQFLERVRLREQLDEGGRLLVAGGDSLVSGIYRLEQISQVVAVRLDLARRVVVFHHKHAHILSRMRRVIGVELGLAEQHHTAAPVEVILVEVIRGGLRLTGALVVGQRVALPLLTEDMDFKFGTAFQPALKIGHEMGFGHVQTGRRGWW